ncbi:hypothetical protein HNR55_002343 [Acetobacter lovaniensis]|jgi:hypothetical protein|uniref:Uncharacterized protein n=1 Tax=Acetobacter lovaniensis TaxID=104100 RepID=A0A841QGR8_9PROT|nr:hypothetical protein [Acetobacter lovaniensis]
MLYNLVFFILGLRAGGRACSGQRGIYSGLLLSPNPSVPEGFVNVQSGQTHPIVW